MRNIFLICSTLLFTLIISCDKNSDDDFKLVTSDFLENKELFNCVTCFSVSNIHASSGFVIRDDKTYKIYADSMRIHPLNSNCDTATLIKIDFTKYSLIGILTEHGACDSINRELNVDNEGKIIKYKIDIFESKEPCNRMLIVPLNFVIINRIPDNYIVNFNIKRYNK